MNVLIIANFCGDFEPNDNGRFQYIARLLSKQNDVEIVTSTFFHASKKERSPQINQTGYKISFLFEPGYPKNICIQRFYSHFLWGRNVAKYLKKREKPDVIYCAIPSLSACLAASRYCINNKVKFIIDVQDLWPEAFQMVFHIPVISDLLFMPFRLMVNRIYAAADSICAVSKTYVNRAMSVNHKCRTGHCAYLGTRLDTFDKNALMHRAVNKPEDELWLGYCGTLGASYDLICVFDAMVKLRENSVTVPQFIIMGDGPRKKEFEDYATKMRIPVRFAGRLPYDEMCGMLASCDIVVNPITSRAAQSIINKHADYAASGLPVVNTQECEEYQNLVNEYRMGFNCKNSDAADVANKLQILIQNPSLRVEMGKGARRCAEERFDRAVSYKIIVDEIEKMGG